MSDTELEAKLTQFLTALVQRLPEGKTVSTPVVQQLLRSKHMETYGEAFIASHDTFIANHITRLMEEKANANKKSESEEEESDSEGSSADDEAEEEEDEEEDETSELDESDDEEDEEDGQPELKKAKLEAEAKLTSEDDISTRCKGMVNCLHKLRYPVRAPGAEESVEQYKDYLVEEFKKRNLDPEKYGKSDIKRYEIRKELEELQKASGVPMDLDKRQRVGRGLAGISLQKDTPTTKDDDWFLDN